MDERKLQPTIGEYMKFVKIYNVLDHTPHLTNFKGIEFYR